jgi:hypothetical protein
VQYIYRLISEQVIPSEKIDGVQFIDYTVEVKGISKKG